MKIIRLHNNPDQIISETIKVLRQGGLVIFPSDTVYGLLVDATKEQAVQKLIAFKNRPPGKAISVFVADMGMLEQQTHVTSDQRKLLDQLLPGPFTVVLPSRHKVNTSLESETGTLGVRIPQHSLVISLVNQYKGPITATSANLAGRSPNYSIESLLNDLPQEKKQLIDLIVDAGTLPRNKPSTVVDLTRSKINVLREGDIKLKDVQTYITTSEEQTQKTAEHIVTCLLAETSNQSLVFILEGDLGTGKTQFVKGAAGYLGVNNIISPTFVVYYEYDIDSLKSNVKNRNYKKLIHADLYNIDDPMEFNHLGLDKLVKSQNILFIEWGEKLGELYKKFSEEAKVIYLKIQYLSETERQITVKY